MFADVCVFVLPLLESLSTRRTACRRKLCLRSVGQSLCSDVCLSTCRYEGLAFLVYIFDVLLVNTEFCRPLVVYVRVKMFELRNLGSGRSEGASRRLQMHLI